MNYYDKYIKYKKKYIELKDKNYILMQGGGKPLLKIIKGINLFEENSLKSKYLNPIYGFFWNDLGAIKNYFDWNNTDDFISRIVKKCFNKVTIKYQPTHSIFFEENICKKIGILLGFMFTRIEKNDVWEKISNDIKIKISIIDNYLDFNSLSKKMKKKKAKKKKSLLKDFPDDDITSIFSSYNNKFTRENLITFTEKLKELKEGSIKSQLKNYIQIALIDNGIFDKIILKKEYNLLNIEDPIYNEENLIENLKKYKENLEEILMPKITKIKGTYTDVFKKWYNHNNFKHGFNNQQIFHVFLAIVWYCANNKNGIQKYYEGLNYYLTNKVTIPGDFLTQVFNTDDFRENESTYDDEDDDDDDDEDDEDFSLLDDEWLMNESELDYKEPDIYSLITHIFKQNPIQLFQTEVVKFSYKNCKVNFSDCGEATLRSFISVLIYDPVSGYNIETLKNLGASEKIIEFFLVYNTEKDVDIMEKKDFEGLKLNSRDAWGFIVSNLNGTNDINYNNYCKIDANNKFKYEIASGLNKKKEENNMLTVLKKLFNKIEKWDDFNNLPEILIKTKFKDSANGNILIKRKVKDNVFKYNWIFDPGHYDFILNNEQKKSFTYSGLKAHKNNDLIFYCRMKFTKIEDVLKNIKNYEKITRYENWYYFINYSNDIYDINSLPTIFNYSFDNDTFFNNDLYSSILIYINKNFTDEQKNKIKLNIKKFSEKFNNEDFQEKLEIYGFKFNRVDSNEEFYSTFHQNVKEINIKIKNENELKSDWFEKFVNLKTLYCNYENLINIENLPNSIEKLSYKGVFNNKIIININKLTKLKHLILNLGYNDYDNVTEKINSPSLSSLVVNSGHYNKDILKIDTLNNLKTLYLERWYWDKFLKQDVDIDLSKLQKLFLPRSSTNNGETIKKILEKIKDSNNLEYLEFPQQIKTNDNNYTRLDDLFEGYEGNPLPMNLKSLTINGHMKSLAIINNLTKLEELDFGYKFKGPINNSLNNLTNLKKLTLKYGYEESTDIKNQFSDGLELIIRKKIKRGTAHPYFQKLKKFEFFI